MLSKWLRLLLVLEFWLSAATTWILYAFIQWSMSSATAVGLSVFIGLNSLVPIATGLLALFWRRRPAPRLRPALPRALRAVLLDWPAFLALYLFLQPFPGLWMRREPRDALPGSGPLVILVHGYCCNRALWWWFARQLRRHGFRVATVDLEPPFAGIDRLAAVLGTRVAELTAAGHDNAGVVLIGSSMGGLVARAFLTGAGGRQISGLITIGTPHQGTALAHLGLGANARDMEPGSPFLARLASTPLPPIPILTIWSTADTFVMPPERARLQGAHEREFSDIGHLAMKFSPRVLRLVLAELQAYCRADGIFAARSESPA